MHLFHYKREQKRKYYRSTLVSATLFICAVFISGMGFTAESELELNVKSAYIYNFIQFIDWQEEGNYVNGPIKICVIGNDPLGEMLLGLTSRQIKGRSIKVDRHIHETGDLSGYHIIVIGRSVEERLPVILRQLENANVLTVSDIQQFAKKGGGVGLVTTEGKVKIEINSGATLRAGLKVSAKLLEVARIVQ
jgi:hypothetical protein